MSNIPANLFFDASWEIDQQVDSGTASVGAGVTAIYTMPPSINVPLFHYEIQFKPNGSNLWFRSGKGSTTGGISSGMFLFGAYVQGSQLFINVSTAGTARYYIYSDKVNY